MTPTRASPSLVIFHAACVIKRNYFDSHSLENKDIAATRIFQPSFKIADRPTDLEGV